MIRDPRPREPEISEAKTPSENHAAAVSSATPASVATTSTVPNQASSTKQDAPDANLPIPAKPASETALKPAPPQTPDPEPQASGLTANTEPFEGRPREDHKRVISSSGSAAPTKRDDASSHSPQATTPVTKKVVKKVIKKLLSDPKRQAKDGPPASQTGKPIPPPPRSVSGRSIPPPPSGRAQTSTGGRQGANKPPSGRGPAGRAPASRGPGGRGPAGRGPAGRGPAGKAPAGRGPAGRAPAGRGPAGKGPAGRGPAGKPSTTRPRRGTPPRAARVVLQRLVVVRDLAARRAEEALGVDVARQHLLGVAQQVPILVVPLVAVVGRIKVAVRRAEKVGGAAIVKSSNRWTCRITRPWMLPCLKVRW